MCEAQQTAKIKICGLFREADVEFANEAGPDFIGFVFAESRRRVSPAAAARLRSRLREGIVPVGVFVNAPPEEIAALYRDGLIAAAQLHGGEDAAYIRRLKTLSAAAGPPVPVIKTLRISAGEEGRKNGNHNEPLVREHREKVKLTHMVPGTFFGAGDASLAAEIDYLLFDSGSGGGKPFDWNLLPSLLASHASLFADWGDGGKPAKRGWSQGGDRTKAAAGKKGVESGPPSWLSLPWFLAGGVCLENIGRALAYRPFGIDVSSGAETGGLKDREKMIALVARAREEQV
ncbi:MAG: phosphoribosylanthranilate isomerase [Treponema sp.]|jgi:phosphoribosylanthranilate isomerase|nr:phosphoribosylanthranilate isomerase [Treponema sp.]